MEIIETVRINLGEKLSFDWIFSILMRNIVGTWIICGGWDWILYFSPISEKFKPFKVLNTFFTSLFQEISNIFGPDDTKIPYIDPNPA